MRNPLRYTLLVAMILLSVVGSSNGQLRGQQAIRQLEEDKGWFGATIDFVKGIIAYIGVDVAEEEGPGRAFEADTIAPTDAATISPSIEATASATASGTMADTAVETTASS